MLLRGVVIECLQYLLAGECGAVAKDAALPGIGAHNLGLRKRQIEENGLLEAYQRFVKQTLDGMTANEQIFQGYTPSGNRRYIPHTLENVVKLLKKDLRGGEGFHYGVGSIRSHLTPQFKSIETIRKAKDRLVSAEQFEAIKKEIDAEFSSINLQNLPTHCQQYRCRHV